MLEIPTLFVSKFTLIKNRIIICFVEMVVFSDFRLFFMFYMFLVRNDIDF